MTVCDRAEPDSGALPAIGGAGLAGSTRADGNSIGFAPLHRSYNLQASRHWGLARGEEDHAKQRVKLDALLARIEANGAVKSSDFERSDGESGGWWGWKEEKRWLEALFAKGELMVARRENFQRV